MYVTCECGRAGSRSHSIARGCPGMNADDDSLIPGIGTGMVRYRRIFDPTTGHNRLVPFAGYRSEPPVTADVIASYEAELVHAGRKDSTLMSYRKAWARFERAFPRLPTDRRVILDYLGNYDGSTGRHRLNNQDTIHGLYKHAATLGWLPSDIMNGMLRPNVQDQMPNPMDLAEVGLILDLDLSLRERAAFHLLAGHGWRQNELLGISAGEVWSICEKGLWCHGKQRSEWAPVLPETAELLRQMADGLADDDRVFRGERGRDERLGYEGMRKLVRGLMERGGLARYTGHNLRDTFATLVTKESGDQTLAMALIRDKIPGVASRYVARDLPILLERFSPLRQVANLSVQKSDTPPPEQEGECSIDSWWRRGRVELPVQKIP